ncbi:hypothetical protein EAE89_00240 [Photorhabdus heterorhabditis]|nr:hypothetical protein [Photorhabdus heterorhabditis]
MLLKYGKIKKQNKKVKSEDIIGNLNFLLSASMPPIKLVIIPNIIDEDIIYPIMTGLKLSSIDKYDDLVGVLIYLDDATSENGCLEVLPRQHTRSFDHSLPDGSFAGMITEEIDEENYGHPVTLAAKAGSTIFLHPFTPHRSAPNVSEQPRKTLIFEYRAADAFPIYTGSQLVSMESYVHHLHGNPATYARFGGPSPAIYTPKNIPKSLYELQEVSSKILKLKE